ncbi:site-specific integrase [Demequina maris]|uniref:site-specific integrase n=1 Tax=Demequina maris TaxID=1638982 RepID=UPI0012E036CE|nr:site-specific integrase [Demequina maris]
MTPPDTARAVAIVDTPTVNDRSRPGRLSITRTALRGDTTGEALSLPAHVDTAWQRPERAGTVGASVTSALKPCTASPSTADAAGVASKSKGVGAPLHPGDSDSGSDVSDAIDTYKPSPRRVTEEDWEPIAAFVREAVRDAQPRTRYTARNLLATFSVYADWCYRVCGEELDRAAILQPALIAEWADLAIEDVERTTAGNYRSRLLRIMEVLNPGAARPRMVALPSSKGIDPYTGEELYKIWSWAYGLVKPRNSRDAIVLVAACVGAGLTGTEVAHLRARDVQVDDDGVMLLTSGARPRIVPVLASVEQIFIDAVAGLEPYDFVFRPGRDDAYKNTVSMFVHKYVHGGVEVKTQRLRATWVIGRLREGVPIQAVMKAMGIEDFSAITRFLRNVPDLDVAEFRARLRAESEHVR